MKAMCEQCGEWYLCDENGNDIEGHVCQRKDAFDREEEALLAELRFE
jgi:hypothetical protein